MPYFYLISFNIYTLNKLTDLTLDFSLILALFSILMPCATVCGPLLILQTMMIFGRGKCPVQS